MKVNESIRHHYIPQFILKNFSYDSFNHLNYYDIRTKVITNTNTKEVFMDRNLYRDEINYPSIPVTIENDLARFESDIAKVVKSFLVDKDIELSNKDFESLLIFLSIMGFRSYNTYQSFKNMKDDFLYSKYQKDRNLVDLWKRNLGQLAKCRTFKDINDNPNIDDSIKVFVLRDVLGVFGKYIAIFEKRGNEDFCISDTYPLVINGVTDEKIEYPLFDFFPLSPERVLVLISNGAEGTPLSVRMIDDKLLKKPLQISNEKMKIHVLKIYEADVININKQIIKNAKVGIAFKDISKVSSLPLEGKND